MGDLSKVYADGAADKVRRDQERQDELRRSEVLVLGLVAAMCGARDILDREGIEIGFKASEGDWGEASLVLRKREDYQHSEGRYWTYGKAWWRGDQFIWEWALTDDPFEGGWRKRFALLGGSVEGAVAELVRRLGQGHLLMAPGEPVCLKEVLWGADMVTVLSEQEQRVSVDRERPALMDCRPHREGRSEWRLEKLKRKGGKR